MKKTVLILTISMLFIGLGIAQSPSQNANEIVAAYDAEFGFGANVGTYNGWRDENLANIAAGYEPLNIDGLGLNTLRQWLPEWFLEYWGYDIRKDVYNYYASIDIKNLAVFIGDASDAHKDPMEYCPGNENFSFKNLYEPIWDFGVNGTPVNDSNYFASYCYRLATIYGENVKVWEVLNEPDLDLTGNAILQTGVPGNWWDNNPPPCDTKFGAPITHYIRMLRIAYEVIKSIKPDNLIAVGGLGHPPFLDAILRNTDNPDQGKVNNDFPFKGGAYFDCMSYHSYPHFDGSLQYWDNDIGWFAYKRHSDAAVEGLIKKKLDLDAVLKARGFDGVDKPEKVWVNTETNIPRKTFYDKTLGGSIAQKNYVMKAAIAAMKNDIKQLQFYSLSEEKKFDEAVNDWQLMGFYEFLSQGPHNATLTDAGLGMQTMIGFLKGRTYDPDLTEQMNLPEEMDGGAFVKNGEKPLFVIWAKTFRDSSEQGEWFYDFPSGFEIKDLLCYEWDFNHTGNIQLLYPENVHTPSSPIFLIPEYLSSTTELETSDFEVFPNPALDKVWIRKQGLINATRLEIFDVHGKLVQTNSLQPGLAQQAIDIKNLRSGMFFLRIQEGNALFSKKIIVR
ncbi:MAG: T9SS type A sorting domain-containing protein [Saprospiraceae bacterium]